MSVDNTYKVLLNKLIAGTISDKEKWQLEKASLDDPFLADAIEGYYDNKASTYTISTLNSKINPQKKTTRNIGMKWLGGSCCLSNASGAGVIPFGSCASPRLLGRDGRIMFPISVLHNNPYGTYVDVE